MHYNLHKYMIDCRKVVLGGNILALASAPNKLSPSTCAG